MLSRVYVTVWCPSVCLSVCLSVCPSIGPLQQTRCYRFCCWGRRLLHGRSSAAAAGECGQCHVVGVRRKLNTDFKTSYFLNDFYCVLELVNVISLYVVSFFNFYISCDDVICCISCAAIILRTKLSITVWFKASFEYAEIVDINRQGKSRLESV